MLAFGSLRGVAGTTLHLSAPISFSVSGALTRRDDFIGNLSGHGVCRTANYHNLWEYVF